MGSFAEFRGWSASRQLLVRLSYVNQFLITLLALSSYPIFAQVPDQSVSEQAEKSSENSNPAQQTSESNESNSEQTNDETSAFWKRPFQAKDWRFNFQTTYLWQTHPSFPAAYDGPHSLISSKETGYTLTATLFMGLRPWKGAEIFFNPEMIQSVELSHLYGLGGLSNSENQKTGGPTAKVYHARAFLRQTFDLGGDSVSLEPGPNQFSKETTRKRFVLTVGQMALTDVFDNNSFAHDGRMQFMNWALMTYGAFDYAADARGYTYGVALEYYDNDWAFRFGRFAQPKESNGLPVDFRLMRHYGDNIEIEHDYSIWGQSGKIRILGFRNHAKMGSFSDALDYAEIHGGTPDVSNVRRDQSKLGFGISLEQNISQDAGVFARYSWNDGRTETYAFTEIERSLTVGASVKGKRWFRPRDTVGLAFVQNGLSRVHQRYLSAGGLGYFIGDGRLNYDPERIIEAYYSLQAFKGLWLSGGWQYFWNPAYNKDRGPVRLYSIRMHCEF
jgi:hypothetical protein